MGMGVQVGVGGSLVLNRERHSSSMDNTRHGTNTSQLFLPPEDQVRDQGVEAQRG